MTAIDTAHDLISGTCFEHSTEPAYVMDPDHSCVLAANDAGCALLGYTREELLRTPISSIHPAELAQLGELLGQVLRDGRASTIKLTELRELCRVDAGDRRPQQFLARVAEQRTTGVVRGEDAAVVQGPSRRRARSNARSRSRR